MQFKHVVSTLTATVGLVAVLNAQNPPSTSTPSTPNEPATPSTQTTPSTPSTPSAPSATDKTMSLTGCVTPGTGSGTFMLSSITPDASASAAQSKSAMTPDKSYRLVAQGGGVDLSAHAGHKVAVTGVVREGSSAATGTETDKTRTFEVRSLKMVASTCS